MSKFRHSLLGVFFYFIWKRGDKEVMLKSCIYCGGIHDKKYNCPSKPSSYKVTTHVDKFRWTKLWQNKRKQINERDKHMCQICIRELYNTQTKYNFTDIQTHHVDSIVDAWDRRLDDFNLIALCSYHHSMAERGQIGKEELFEIIKEQESKLEPL